MRERRAKKDTGQTAASAACHTHFEIQLTCAAFSRGGCLACVFSASPLSHTHASENVNKCAQQMRANAMGIHAPYACNRWIGPGSGQTRTGPDQLLGSCLEPLFSCILLLLWMLSLTEITYLNRKYSYVSECNEKTQSKGMQLRKTSARTSPDQSAGYRQIGPGHVFSTILQLKCRV